MSLPTHPPSPPHPVAAASSHRRFLQPLPPNTTSDWYCMQVCTMSSSPVSAQKKRALDALTRRFAVDAHHQFKPNPNPKSMKFSEQKTVGSPTYNPPPSTTRQVGLSSSVMRPETLKSADTDVHPIYHEIFGGLDDNLVQVTGEKDLSRQNVVSSIVNDIVSKGEEGSKFGKGGKRLKIYNWILLDNFVAKDDSLMNARLKAITCQSKRSRLHMSKWQHRKCGSFNLPKEFHRVRSCHCGQPYH